MDNPGYINSPFPYAGCKYDLLEHLDAALPQQYGTLFDVFGGSGAVGVNLAYRFGQVYITDILSDLVSMHRNLQSDEPDHIVARLRELSSREPEKYAELRNAYNSMDPKDPDRGYRLYGLILSCTNNLMRFNRKGGFNQTCGKRQLTDNKEREIRAWCERLKSYGDRIKFGSAPFDKVLSRIREGAFIPEATVIYLDPPYSNTQAGYNSTWTVDDDDRLAEFMMQNHAYRYVLSSCRKDGKTTRLVETLMASGQYEMLEVPHFYKAAKKTRNSDTVELILRNFGE